MTDDPQIRIVAFGDSITQAAQQPCEHRWPEIVRRGLQAQFPALMITMVNAGVGGNTSREGLLRMEQDVLSHRPHVVTVEFGNDATPDPARHVSFDEFTANLERIRTALWAHGCGQLVLLTFPPIIDAWHHAYEHEFYRQNGGQDVYQEHYRTRTRDFAHTHGCPLVDVAAAFRAAMRANGPDPYILKDGIHLSRRGNELVASLVQDCLSKLVLPWRAVGPSSE